MLDITILKHINAESGIGFLCWCCLVTQLCPRLFVTSMNCRPPVSSVHGIHRQEYWSGLPFPSPGDLPDPGFKPASPAWQEDTLPLSHQESTQLHHFYFVSGRKYS